MIGSLCAMVAGQASKWVEETDVASSHAREIVRAKFPAYAWAFEKWERCRSGRGEYTDSGIILLVDCEQSVISEAAKRGEAVRVAVVNALSEQGKAAELASQKIEPAWPLLVVRPAVNRVVLLLMGA